MFGWRIALHGRRTGIRYIGIGVERRETATWIIVELWSWVVGFRKLRAAYRETGPEENRSVLSYFLAHARPRQRKNRHFAEGFDRRSTKPVLSRAEIQQRNRAAVASGKFTPLIVVDGAVCADPRFSR